MEHPSEEYLNSDRRAALRTDKVQEQAEKDAARELAMGLLFSNMLLN